MKTEKVIALVFVVTILFKLFHFAGGGALMTIDMTTLSFLYLMGGVYFFSDKTFKRQNIALSIIAGIFMCIAPMAILFKVQYWRGAQVELFLSISALFILFVITLIFKHFSKEDLKIYYQNMLTRITILFVLCIVLYVTPIRTLVNIQYSGNEEQARILGNYYAHPENDSFKSEYLNYTKQSKNPYK